MIPTTTGTTTGALECEPPSGPGSSIASLIHVTGAGKQTLQAVALDGAGNTYVAGNFDQEIAIGGFQHALAIGEQAPFVAKFDCAGALQWFTAGEPQDAGASGVALALVVGETEVYIGGRCAAPLSFGALPVLAGGGAFVASFAVEDGAPTAATTALGQATEVRALALGDAGQLFAAGDCASADPDTFGFLIAALAPALDQVTPRCLLSPPVIDPMNGEPVRTTTASAVAVSGDAVFIAGQITGPVAGDEPVVVGAANGFVARVGLDLPEDSEAMFAGDSWIVTLGSSYKDRVNGLAVTDDGSGDVVVVGLGEGQFFPGLPGCEDDSLDRYTGFVTRLSALDGGCVAHDMLESGTIQAGEVHAVAVHQGAIYVLGQFVGTLEVAGDTIADVGDTGIRMFLLDLDSELRLNSHAISDQEPGGEICVGDGESRALGYGIAASAEVVAVVADACGDGVGLGGQAIADSDAILAGFVP
ncbi:hypothetical protein [Nannocystis bainbridge]|uniref:Uncharacterized protein n=1 Tax=Nannocystis bainbridge TaxID=2995303 RepID=A0ABT5DT56_9BACT|nr:hypothetical protein [Nannocystis bainbridge]MDC0716764.1 hypothetical protein [Nannocystis bainbridge]